MHSVPANCRLAVTAEIIRRRTIHPSSGIILQEYRVIITGGDAVAIGHRAG